MRVIPHEDIITGLPSTVPYAAMGRILGCRSKYTCFKDYLTYFKVYLRREKATNICKGSKHARSELLNVNLLVLP